MLRFKTLSITLKTLFAVLFLLFAAIANLSAQKTELASSASLEQCRNGSAASPAGCTAVGGATGWVTGNAGSSNSHWAETQFIAIECCFPAFPTARTRLPLVMTFSKTESMLSITLVRTMQQRLRQIRASGSAAAAARRRAPLRFQLS